MEYLIPAWHSQLKDWSITIPQIEIYDGVNFLHVLKNSGRKVGLVLTDYQPQAFAKISNSSVNLDSYISIFDYLQGVENFSARTLDYRDFNWPKNVTFDYTSFVILVYLKNDLIARVILDTNGRVLFVEYYNHGQITKKLTIDSRGFISSEESDKDIRFFDPVGYWRFLVDKQTNQVKINPQFSYFNKQSYDSLQELLNEVMQEKFLKKIKKTDHLIVTLDDDSTISYQNYADFSPIYVLNKRHPYQRSIQQVITGQIIVPAQADIKTVTNLLTNNLPVSMMPSYPTQVTLGHSQRLNRQIIAVFAEYMNYRELKQVAEMLYQRLIARPKDEGLQFLTYSIEQETLVQQVIAELKQAHDGSFLIEGNIKVKSENQIEMEDDLPIIYLKNTRLTSLNDLVKTFDKLRVLINWNQSDDLIETAAIGAGIPRLQNFESFSLVNYKNGEIFHSIEELNHGLDDYLHNLDKWNQALVYNVELLNRYSEENLIQKWDKLLK
ncbi:accessory secretory protein Asp1 [Lactobacillus colini]|uniref:Accessory secretory protein Asp1 n=1 Tax=Lactobacillus colini TaxID=1819254 RepID=A0ABS4MGP3_9LACO|nr:accessory Sec system protein Asp1 [Lactobacillus colini]MBP2058874.1 accessory secretory protein Asp1 [Lactobacillus colini]